jgi:hypothetical protein
MSASSSSSAPSATVSQTTYSCPSVNNQTVIDANGATYRVSCGSDLNAGGNFGGASPDFNGCMTICDNTNGCGGWTYVADVDCYMMIANSKALAFVPSAASYVAGIRNETVGGAGTTSGDGPPTCPSMNGTTITDARGAKYSIMCGRDGQGTLITTSYVNGDGINGCFAACDSTPQCGAFTYSGDPSMTSGTCYLKENLGEQNQSPVADTIAEALLVSPATIAASSSSSSSAPTASNGAGAGTGGSGTGSGSAASSSAPSSSAASSSTASFSAACTGPPLPSGSGSPTVINPDGSTSNYTGLLANPTRCDFGDPIDTEEDDSYCEVDLPFAMAIYGGSSTQTFPTTNGVCNI